MPSFLLVSHVLSTQGAAVLGIGKSIGRASHPARDTLADHASRHSVKLVFSSTLLPLQIIPWRACCEPISSIS